LADTEAVNARFIPVSTIARAVASIPDHPTVKLLHCHLEIKAVVSNDEGTPHKTILLALPSIFCPKLFIQFK